MRPARPHAHHPLQAASATRPAINPAATFAALALSASTLPGCALFRGSPTPTFPDARGTDITAVRPGSAISDDVIAALDAALSEADRNRDGSLKLPTTLTPPPTATTPDGTNPQLVATPPRGASPAGVTPPADATNPAAGVAALAAAPVAPAAAPPATLTAAVHQVIAMVNDPTTGIQDPVRRAALVRSLLAMVEAPTAAGPQADATSPGSASTGLTPAESRLLAELAALLAAAAEPDADLDLADRLADRVRSLSQAVEAERAIAINRVELCEAVTGFGEFIPISSTAFLAGRVNRMIVYTELAGFRQTSAVPVSGGGEPVGPPTPDSPDATPTFQVVTSLSCQLFTADGLNIWNTTPERHERTSRTPIQDYHRIQVISLPPTLAPGSYTLKVAVVDEVGKSRAEGIIPLKLVADVRLVGRAGGTPLR